MKAYTDIIFDSIASGVVTTDTVGQVTTFNHSARKIFDLQAEQAIGRTYRKVLAGIGDEELSEIMHHAVARSEVTLGHEIELDKCPGAAVKYFCGSTSLHFGRARARAQTLGVAMVVDDLTELRHSQRQTREIQRLFGRYVHPAVRSATSRSADPSAVHLGGETREISVVFADIRGYTRLAEELAPADLRADHQFILEYSD